MTRLLLLVLTAFALPVAAQSQALPRVPAPRYNDLMTPVVVGDLAGVKEALALGKPPDKPDSQGRTPLLVALELDRPEIAQVLLEAGADPERSKQAARVLKDPKLLAAVERVAERASVGTTRR
jgi:ankyrin repeat protein